MGTDSHNAGADKMRLITLAVYFLVLVVALAFMPMAVFPYADAGYVPKAIAVALASLTLPGTLLILGDYRLPGHAVAGLFGSMAGIGALYSPTTSVMLGLRGELLPMAFSAITLYLVVRGWREEAVWGCTGPITEVALTVLMGCLVMCPTVSLFLI